MPLRFSDGIPIRVPYDARGFDCLSSDDGVCPESKTDTGHKCGMYMWFVDLYIGTVRLLVTQGINRFLSHNSSHFARGDKSVRQGQNPNRI